MLQSGREPLRLHQLQALGTGLVTACPTAVSDGAQGLHFLPAVEQHGVQGSEEGRGEASGAAHGSRGSPTHALYIFLNYV